MENNPDTFGGIDPPSDQIPIRWVDVNGREEHEELLKDPLKMISLGLDPYYETMVYLKRWGNFLDQELNHGTR